MRQLLNLGANIGVKNWRDEIPLSRITPQVLIYKNIALHINSHIRLAEHKFCSVINFALILIFFAIGPKQSNFYEIKKRVD